MSRDTRKSPPASRGTIVSGAQAERFRSIDAAMSPTVRRRAARSVAKVASVLRSAGEVDIGEAVYARADGVAPGATPEQRDLVVYYLLIGAGQLFDRVKAGVDSLSEMGETESLRLQMAMDRLSELMATLSNIEKKLAQTEDTIIQNLK